MTKEELVKYVDEVNLAIAGSSFDSQTKKWISRRFGFCRGYYYGVFGFDRDWSEGDVWHRGYMAGSLRRHHAELEANRLSNRDADQDPHQVDIGGEG